MILASVGGFLFIMIFLSFCILYCISWGKNPSQKKEQSQSRYQAESDEWDDDMTPGPKIPEIEQQIQISSMEHQIDKAAKKTKVVTDYILKLYASCSVFFQSFVAEQEQAEVLSLIEQCYNQLKSGNKPSDPKVPNQTNNTLFKFLMYVRKDHVRAALQRKNSAKTP